ncbi:hypothetical protein ACTFIW_000937 [Dictyostelium discoideum]
MKLKLDVRKISQVNQKEQRSQTIIVKIELSFQVQCQNELTQVAITLQETVAMVNPVVGVMADLTTSMDRQVMLHHGSENAKSTRRYQQPFSKEQEVNLPVDKWIESSSTSNFKQMPNPLSLSIPEGPKSDCITKKYKICY